MYDLMRMRKLEYSLKNEQNRLIADVLFYALSLEDGYDNAKAYSNFKGLRFFGTVRILFWSRNKMRRRWPWKFHSGFDITQIGSSDK